jgi:hypothetical protein
MAEVQDAKPALTLWEGIKKILADVMSPKNWTRAYVKVAGGD